MAEQSFYEWIYRYSGFCFHCQSDLVIGIVFIGLKESTPNRILMILVGFSSGTLIGSAFLDLLPEALGEYSALSETVLVQTFSYAILGIVAFFATEKFLY